MKTVFFVSQPLKGLVLETLKDIIRSSKFQFVTLVTNLNPACYDEDMDYIDTIRDNILFWMENAVRFFKNFSQIHSLFCNCLY